MFLKRVVFVNWGNVPNSAFECGPVNLFSGANGSGKTTAADAVQTIMTAAHENLFHYNPGQEESTQRGRGGKRVRTLASYVLGCDDGSYARTETTDGYIAAIFHPTQDESATPFTAVIAVRAWLDASGKQSLAREDQVFFLILPEVELDLDAFVQEDNGAKHVVRIDEVQQRLVTAHGKRAVERYDQKRAYLRRLYGALRGKRDSVAEREAMAAARAFSRFMAYKPVSSINQFVAEEVLERKDLGDAIRSVSSQLKTIHGMERDAQGLKESALLLETAGHQAQVYLETWVELQTLQYSQARSGFLTQQSLYLKAVDDRDTAERNLRDNAREIELVQKRHESVTSALISAEAQRQGIPALKQKDELEKERTALDGQISGAAVALLHADRQSEINLRSASALLDLLASPSIASDLGSVANMESLQLARAAHDTGKAGRPDVRALLQKDLTNDLATLENHLDQARQAQRAQNELLDFWQRRESLPESRRDTVASANQSRRQRYEQISSQLLQKQQEITRLEAKQVVYPAHVDRALNAIRTQCPQADARVLCDHIEVTDTRWQSAIEGYLGGARFGIIVDADYEAEAIRIVRGLPGRDNRARVIQGSKAARDAARMSPPQDSILNVMKFTHAVAQAFVTASFGTVVRVSSAEELRHTARGVTMDGMGSGGYAMFRCDVPDADLVFGASARERALQARRIEADRLTAERQEANLRMQESTRLLEAIDALKISGHADSMAQLLELHRAQRRVELLLRQLDTSAFESLDAQLASLRADDRRLRDELSALNRRTGELTRDIAAIASQIQNLSAAKEAAQEKLGATEQALQAAHAVWPEFDLEARLRFADAEASSLNASHAEASGRELQRKLQASEHQLSAVLQQHNQKCRPVDAVAYIAFNGNFDAALFASISELRRELDRIYNILRNNVLVEKHEQLKTLKTSFNDAFVSHLCQEIHQSLQDGKRQLELLNRELVNHRFGSDREQFRFAQEWLPEYREYARFFEEVVRSPAGGGETTLFEAELSQKSAQVRDALLALLLGADEQKSLRELERIADYRNYHRYEIYKEVEGKPPIALSEYGTGSGGQLETPAYIIRAASITSALRYAEGTNHLRMVLVDEAFSKMDETRSREVIGYLTQSLGLQLIFIMPTSKCGPFMDLISNEFVFAKVPSPARGQLHTRVLVDRKKCNQERIAELWQRHRRTVHQQAELDFMADVLGPGPAPAIESTPAPRAARGRGASGGATEGAASAGNGSGGRTRESGTRSRR